MGFGRVVRRPELEHELMFLAEIDLLHVLAFGEVPEMQAPAVFAAEQNFRNETVLERIGCAPFAGDHRVIAEMPPCVVAELLRSALDLPTAERLERLLIHDEDAAGCLAVLVSERGDVDAPGSAMDGVRARVSGLLSKLFRLDGLDDFGRARIGPGTANVVSRRSRGTDDQHTQLRCLTT